MTQLVINNFVKGMIDHSLNGRFDLGFYHNGFEVSRNFFSNYQGNLKFRTGFEYVSEPRGGEEAFLTEFKFNTEQSYLLEFTEGKLRFYTYDAAGNFGYVLGDGGNPIELDTGITLAQAKTLRKAQNADVMYLTTNGINPKKLKRTAANVFTIENVVPSGINFEETGFPSCCCFYSGRLWYAGFEKKPMDVYGSKTVEYDYFTIPESDIKPEDALKLTLAEICDPISFLTSGRTNLYVGNPEGMTLINGGGYDTAITSTEVDSTLANYEGVYPSAPALKDNMLFYIGADQRRVYAFDYDLLTEKFTSFDLNLAAYDCTRGKLKQIVYKRDENNLIYCLLETGQLLYFVYNQSEGINGFFPTQTQGNINCICSVTRPDGEDDLFIQVERFGVQYIEKISPFTEFHNFYQTEYFEEDTDKRYFNRLIAEDLKSCCYLDNSSRFSLLKNINITISGEQATAADDVFETAMEGRCIVFKTKTGKEYGWFKIKQVLGSKVCKIEVLSDGYYPESYDSFYITFIEIGGLDDWEGKSIRVVADGGYLGDFTVTDGKIGFDREITSLVAGFGYEGFFKTFNIGMADGGKNYQTSKKRISEFILRFVMSGGCKIGTDINRMQEVQMFSPGGFLDLPPLPMDGDEKRTAPDDTNEHKCIFFKQDLPLPVNLTMLQYNIDFS